MQEFDASGQPELVTSEIAAEGWITEQMAMDAILSASNPIAVKPGILASTDHSELSVGQQSIETELEQQISRLLRAGVVLASTIVLMGGILYLMRHGSEPVNYHVFQSEPAALRSPVGIIRFIQEDHPRGIIQLGLLILIATPILRVLLSLVTFLRWQDSTYVVITSLVLVGLICSFVGAYF